jgi:hypothetical protein
MQVKTAIRQGHIRQLYSGFTTDFHFFDQNKDSILG